MAPGQEYPPSLLLTFLSGACTICPASRKALALASCCHPHPQSLSHMCEALLLSPFQGPTCTCKAFSQNSTRCPCQAYSPGRLTSSKGIRCLWERWPMHPYRRSVLVPSTVRAQCHPRHPQDHDEGTPAPPPKFEANRGRQMLQPFD